jgi:HPt (histidine-containing phosphotransfer) domain-containing protein
MNSIEQCVNNKDLNGAAREAHNIKPSAMTLGAIKLGEICQSIENLKNSNQTEELKILYKDLKNTYEKSCLQLHEIKSDREHKMKNIKVS